MEKKLIYVPYLEGSDIVSAKKINPNILQGKSAVIMLQGDFCGYCTMAKPEFQSFFNDMKDKIFIGTIQIDGGSSDKEANQKLQIPTQGVPAYLGFDKNGNFVKIHEGKRDSSSLKQFAMSL
jgi:hypothetical protein